MTSLFIKRKDLQVKKLLCIFIVIFVFTSSALAQDDTNPLPVIGSLAERSVFVPAGYTQTYEIYGCNSQSIYEPCYLSVTAEALQNDVETHSPSMAANHSRTIICTYQIKNGLNQEMGRLVQNVGVTFHTSMDRIPATLDWGDLRGTVAYGPMSKWISTSGPNPTPGWGMRANNSAYAISNGTFEYGIPTPCGSIQLMTVNVSVRMAITYSGWGCY